MWFASRWWSLKIHGLPIAGAEEDHALGSIPVYTVNTQCKLYLGMLNTKEKCSTANANRVQF